MDTDGTEVAIFMRHRAALVEYAAPIVGCPSRAEDVVQEAFLRFRKAATEKVLDEPVGYLYRIVRNLALDRRRTLNVESRHVSGGMDAEIEQLAKDTPSPEDEAISRQELGRVAQALAELPERTRIAVEMHRFGGCTLREIADHLGISVSMAHNLVVAGVRHCLRRL